MFNTTALEELICGNGTILQTVLFYIAATCLFLGCTSVWILRNKVWLNRFLLLFIIPCCVIYASIIVYLLVTDPMLLVNMTFSGVQKQYHSNWIVVSSICHYAVTDIITSRVVLYFMKQVGMGFWKYIPLYVLLFLWPPIGLLIFLVIYFPKKYFVPVNNDPYMEDGVYASING